MKFGQGLKILKLAVDRNILFFAFSQGTALFQQLDALLMIFLGKYSYKVVLQSMKFCEVL